MSFEVSKKNANRLLKVGILASHNGTDMRYLSAAIEQGQLHASIAVVISNNNSSALEFASSKNIPTRHVSRRTHANPDKVIADTLAAYGCNIVVLCGYMRPVGPLTLHAFDHRIINIHPSLLPKYAGLQDMDVHRAVLQNGESQTGVTLHLVTEELDKGKILAQSPISVPKDLQNTKEDLEKRALKLRSLVQAEEGKLLLSFLQEIT